MVDVSSAFTNLCEDAADAKTGEVISGSRPAHLSFIGSRPSLRAQTSGRNQMSTNLEDQKRGLHRYNRAALILCMFSNCLLANSLVPITTLINLSKNKGNYKSEK